MRSYFQADLVAWLGGFIASEFGLEEHLLKSMACFDVAELVTKLTDC